jgi:hypothetical protein
MLNNGGNCSAAKPQKRPNSGFPRRLDPTENAIVKPKNNVETAESRKVDGQWTLRLVIVSAIISPKHERNAIGKLENFA